MDQLAGHGRGFGAVGAPDLTEPSDPAAHCDDADFLAGGYRQSRDLATGRLHACVDHLRRRFREAVDRAGDLLDGQGEVVEAEASLHTDCVLGADEQRAKCESLEAFGRALHGVQDFYSHSNWTDVPDPHGPIDADNPPGLNLPAPSRLLDLRGGGVAPVPRDLTSGCFVVADRVPGVGVCAGRVTHAALNKDTGIIDPVSGGATGSTTLRGRVAGNFAKAVTGAVVETRHQWQELRSALRSEYGADRASRMICALTQDDPGRACRAESLAGAMARTAAAAAVPALLLGALGLGVYLLVRRRRAGGHKSALRELEMLRRDRRKVARKRQAEAKLRPWRT